LGFYITCHPLTRFEAVMKRRSATPTEALGSLEDNRVVRLCGMIVQERVTTTKRGDRMAYLRIEDLTGSVEVIIFPDLYQTAAPLFQSDLPLLFTGTIDRGEKGTKLKATAVVPLADRANVTIALSANRVNPQEIERLHLILKQSPGSLPVYLKITIPDTAGSLTESLIAVDPAIRVDGSDQLTTELEGCFGKGTVQQDCDPDFVVQRGTAQPPF
ncbi:MAG: OB-fold nucleic acid binding domain-containing protein, partial [Nitrospiria bacterium]